MDIVTIQEFIKQNKYRVKSHAVRHMIEEGFDEDNCIEALLNGRILEIYPEEERCLVLGTFHFTPTITSHLHIVCDYSQSERIDIVTAYIPQRFYWETPTRRRRIKK